MSVQITEQRLRQIKSALGFPIEDDKFLLDDEQIKEFCIEPALRKYFSKFPKIIQDDYMVSAGSNLNISFYNDDTFGAVDARLTNTEMSGVGGLNEFLYTYSYNQTFSSSNFGRRGYNPNSLSQANKTAQQALRTQAKMHRAIRTRVDYNERQITVFSNTSGRLLIYWALYSNNFDEVKYNYIEDVLNLCKGYLLTHAGGTMGIFQNTELPIEIDVDFLMSRGNEMIEKVEERWEQIPGIVLINNT